MKRIFSPAYDLRMIVKSVLLTSRRVASITCMRRLLISSTVSSAVSSATFIRLVARAMFKRFLYSER